MTRIDADRGTALLHCVDRIPDTSLVPEILRAQQKRLGLNGLVQAQLVLSPEFYSLLSIDRPPVLEEELREAVRWQIQDQLEFPVEDAFIDVFGMPEGLARRDERIFVVAAPRQILKNVAKAVQEANIELNKIDVSELALRDVVWSRFPQADESVALLTLGQSGGLIGISRGDGLYLSRRIQAAAPGLAPDKFALIKEQLLLQVQRSLDYYQGAMGQQPCKLLVVACYAEYAPELLAYLAEVLPIPVRSLGEVMEGEVALQMVSDQHHAIDWSNCEAEHHDLLVDALPALGASLIASLDPLGEVA